MRRRLSRAAGTTVSQKASSFSTWLKSIPPLSALLASAIAAASGLLAPERVLPQPLVDFRWIPSALLMTAFVVAWSWRKALRRHMRALTASTAALFVVVVCLNLFFVRPVEYDSPRQTVFYLVGLTATVPGCGNSPDIIIRQCGGEWSDLSAAWGTSYLIVALAYVLSYILFTGGIVLSIGSSMSPTDQKPSRPAR
jgi:hypothetical protein